MSQANANAPSEYERIVAFFSDRANLTKRLQEFNAQKKTNRIFVMGCGRSGTWLLTSIFSTFQSISIYPDEVHFALFGAAQCKTENLLLKRNERSYELVENIVEEIGIAYIVRHPFDVLTSRNPTTNRKYHIQPWRWLGEMEALRYLIDTQRPNTKILRYEDLVSNPDEQQAEIGAFFNLRIGASTAEIGITFNASPAAQSAMHGVRQIDSSSVGKYKQDPEKLAYIKSILPRLGRNLHWLAETFDYDVAR